MGHSTPPENSTIRMIGVFGIGLSPLVITGLTVFVLAVIAGVAVKAIPATAVVVAAGAAIEQPGAVCGFLGD